MFYRGADSFAEICRRVALVSFLLLMPFRLGFAQTNVLTFHNDNFHTGQYLSEFLLTPATVSGGHFAAMRLLQTDGRVDGQPLYAAGLKFPDQTTHNVVFAATEHDSAYAFDADNGAILWQVSLLKAGETPSDPRGCGQVLPEIGVTATPVIDLKAGTDGTIYLVSMSKNSDDQYHQRLHALDILTGQEEFGGPVDINATFPGNGDDSGSGLVVFDPKMYKERSGLVLSHGVIYTSWSSHCDIRPYTGWVIGFDESSLAQTLVFNFTPNGEGGTIWGSGAGPAVDPDGNLFFQLANGTFEPSLDMAGFPPNGDYGNSFVKLSTDSLPVVRDYWTMNNTVDESDADADLGSGGVLLLPDVVDADGNVRHLGTGAGKDGNVYMFDRDNMGKFDPSNNSNIYQELPGGLSGGEFATPAWFNNTIYFGAIDDSIRAFPVIAARLSTVPAAVTPNTFSYPGTTPVISANGTQNGILWATENTDPVVLHAYDATNIGTELYNNAHQNGVNCGGGVKWIPPAVADGKVLVPTTSGVCIFGLLESRCPLILLSRCPRAWRYCGCDGILEPYFRHGPPPR